MRFIAIVNFNRIVSGLGIVCFEMFDGELREFHVATLRNVEYVKGKDFG